MPEPERGLDGAAGSAMNNRTFAVAGGVGRPAGAVMAPDADGTATTFDAYAIGSCSTAAVGVGAAEGVTVGVCGVVGAGRAAFVFHTSDLPTFVQTWKVAPDFFTAPALVHFMEAASAVTGVKRLRVTAKAAKRRIPST